MVSDGEQLARLRVATATGRLPREVGEWALGRLMELEPAGTRRRARDDHLRSALALLPGSRWARARALAAMLQEVRACYLACRFESPPAFGVRWYAWAAILADPRAPASVRHLLRLSDKIAVDLSLGSGGRLCE